MLVACILLGAGTTAGAAELFKCKDAKGRITYASVNCAEQGLAPAGRIREATTVVPAPAKPATQKPAASESKPDPVAGDTEKRAPVGIKPINPLIERLLK